MDEIEKELEKASYEEKNKEKELLQRPSRHSKKASPTATASATATSSGSGRHHNHMFFENPTNDQLPVIKRFHENLLENQILYSDILTSGGFVPGTEGGEYDSDSDYSDDDGGESADATGNRRYHSPEKAREILLEIKEQLLLIPALYDFERAIHSYKAKHHSWKPHIEMNLLKGVNEKGENLFYAEAFYKAGDTKPFAELEGFTQSICDILEGMYLFYSMV